MAETPTSSSGVTLTQATHLGRLVVKYGAIALVVMIVGRIFLTAVITFWKATHPPPPPPPTVGFGSLPVIDFPNQDELDKPSAYQLETPTGRTPDFGDRAKVFLMTKSTPSLLADQRAREIAASYNFVFEPQILDANTYRWTKNQPLESQLEMDIFTQHFELTTDFIARSDLLTGSQLPDDFEAVNRVKTFLSSARLLPSDVATTSGQVSYLKSLGGEVAEAVSLSDADYLAVNLKRTPIDNAYSLYGPDPTQSSIYAILTGSLSGMNSIVEMNYSYQPVDYDQVHTYPLRTSQAAWKVLQSGEGYIAQLGQGSTAVVRDVELGYYESPQEQEYLQPIYIFSGDDGFMGYVPAIDPEYLQAQ